MRIAVCIATYNRPEGLQRALEGVARQRLPPDLAAGLTVLVVDNNPRGDARSLMEACGSRYPWRLAYVHEPRKGVSHARNAALDNTDGADFIAFIDDDEVPESDWLWRLVELQRQYDADVVSGPVLPCYTQPPPAWLATGRFLDPVRYADGAAIDTTYTGNVLFRRSLVMRLGIRFKLALTLIGGEDVDFFDHLRRSGVTLRYCNRALVYESVPPERMKLRWLLRRWFRTGDCEGMLYMERHGGLWGRLIMVGRGVARIGLGAAALAMILPLGGIVHRHWAVARLYTVARGFGMICSACGVHHYGYAH
jgi:succinoglycan biosynthesis protein ExoM